MHASLGFLPQPTLSAQTRPFDAYKGRHKRLFQFCNHGVQRWRVGEKCGCHGRPDFHRSPLALLPLRAHMFWCSPVGTASDPAVVPLFSPSAWPPPRPIVSLFSSDVTDSPVGSLLVAGARAMLCASSAEDSATFTMVAAQIETLVVVGYPGALGLCACPLWTQITRWATNARWISSPSLVRCNGVAPTRGNSHALLEPR
jgi:hypothetical protein